MPTPKAAAATEPAEPTEDEEEAMLKQAIALSKADDVEMATGDEDGDADGDEEMDEDEAIARAIQMSMESSQGEEGKKGEKEKGKKQ